MRQFWPRIGFVLTAIAGYFITIWDPNAPILESIKALSGVDIMGLILVMVAAFSSPTQIGEAAKAVGVTK